MASRAGSLARCSARVAHGPRSWRRGSRFERHDMTRQTWLRIAVAAAIAVCAAPRAAECQAATASKGSRIRVVSLDTLPSDSGWTTTTERVYHQRLSDAFGD